MIVGGVASWPGRYAPLAKALAELSGAEVRVAAISPPDWLVGRLRGFGQLVFAVATAVDHALLGSAADRAVLVGHSAGGLACRVYLGGQAPYGGRRYSGYRRVSHLVTLGTPHAAREGKLLAPIAEVNRLFPGALHEPKVRYVSVAGAAVSGSDSRRAWARYGWLAPDGRTRGDGVVPVGSALLPGAEHLVFDDLHHSSGFGRWYGSDRETVERWWPEELRAEGVPAGGTDARRSRDAG